MSSGTTEFTGGETSSLRRCKTEVQVADSDLYLHRTFSNVHNDSQEALLGRCAQRNDPWNRCTKGALSDCGAARSCMLMDLGQLNLCSISSE